MTNHNRQGRSWRSGLFRLALAGLALGAVFAAGVVAQKLRLPRQTLDLLTSTLAAVQPGDTQSVSWQQAVLSQYTIEWAAIKVGPATAGGGGLAEANGNIIIATPHGQINYLDRRNRLAPLGIRTPMNLDQLAKSPLMDDPFFSPRDMRTHDLMTRSVGSGRWELYATFSRYVNDDCFQFVLARTLIEADGAGVRSISPEWEDLYIARPGCIRKKDRSRRFAGQQAAGRMKLLGQDKVLVSVGDHQFDGFNDSYAASMDPQSDLGKIIVLDLTTRNTRIYATGLRNPQGLVIMRDGRIFESEHGPQGGDEINLIRDGENYGWPRVTYGMNYGYPRRDWPGDPAPGQHKGFTRPSFAFVPSVGISNIVQPNAHEFPLWGDDDLLVASLRENTLFHLRTEGEHVAYAEPLRFDGEKLRDMICLSNGRIAILSDSGKLILLRNAEHHEAEPDTFEVAGLSTVSTDAADEPEPPHAQRGKQVFEADCSSCHDLSGATGVGPPLNGVVDRRIGVIAEYGYSPALRGRSGRWDERALLEFMTDPQHTFKGTSMPAPTIGWMDAPEVVAFLRTTHANQKPPPSVEKTVRQD